MQYSKTSDGAQLENQEYLRSLLNMLPAPYSNLADDLVLQERLLDHLVWVQETNETVNLTAITDLQKGLLLHVFDSLTSLPELDASPSGTMLDIGSGGGFPGIPLALASGRATVLLDSVGKKAEAVRSFVHSRRLPDIAVSKDRAEDHARTHPEEYAVVVGRAVSSLPSLAELAAPLLRERGTLIALKGLLDEEELRRGDSAASQVGLERTGVRRFTLGPGGPARSVVVYQKVSDPKIALPRRTGCAQKQPLA